MSDELDATMRALADALFPHRDDWWDDASESVNLRHRAKVKEALDRARALGWSPRQ